jgi:hypothetical protein
LSRGREREEASLETVVMMAGRPRRNGEAIAASVPASESGCERVRTDGVNRIGDSLVGGPSVIAGCAWFARRRMLGMLLGVEIRK